MMARLVKQLDEMKATLMQLDDRRAEREAKQGRRELEREDRLSCHQCPVCHRNHHPSMHIMVCTLLIHLEVVRPTSGDDND